MNIKELFKRNTPVFFIGLLTVIIFIIIIASSQLRQPTQPELLETQEDDLVAMHTNTQGPDDARVLIVQFTDLSAPKCEDYQYTLKKLINTYPEYIFWGVRHLPSSRNINSEQAARASQAAGNQNKFWQYIDLLYENSDKLEEGDFIRYSDILNLDLKKFRDDYNDVGIAMQIQNDISYANKRDITNAPAFFINGLKAEINSPEELKQKIEEELTKYGVDVEKIEEEIKTEEEERIENEYMDVYTIVDQRFGIKEIVFENGNFNPRNTSATAGQLVRFINDSENEITITQIMKKFDALEKDVDLKPGEYFEFRLELRSYGLWTYRDVGNPTRASVMVKKLPLDLMEILPEE